MAPSQERTDTVSYARTFKNDGCDFDQAVERHRLVKVAHEELLHSSSKPEAQALCEEAWQAVCGTLREAHSTPVGR